MVLLSGQSKTLTINTQSVCRPLSVINLTRLSAVSCCTVRLTLVCATGKQPAEILIETFRFHAAESFLSTWQFLSYSRNSHIIWNPNVRSCSVILSWARLIQSTPSHAVTLRYILSCHPHLGLASGLFIFPNQHPVCTSLFPIHATYSAHLILFFWSPE